VSISPPASLKTCFAPSILHEIQQWVIAVAAEEIHKSAEQTVLSPYMTPDQAAQWLGSNRRRIDDLCSQGRLTRCHDGRRILLLRAEVEALVTRGGNREW